MVATHDKRPSFSSALSKLLHKSEDGKAKKAVKMTWPIFKGVLRTVKEASDAFPPLKVALTGLLEVLEQYDVSRPFHLLILYALTAW
jgi:hypothetical protein